MEWNFYGPDAYSEQCLILEWNNLQSIDDDDVVEVVIERRAVVT